MNSLYFVAPVNSTWEDLYSIAATHGLYSNDFIGCRTFVATSGRIAVKMAV